MSWAYCEPKSSTSFAVGLSMMGASGGTLTFAPELLYVMKGATIDLGGSEGKFKTSYLELPLLFRANLNSTSTMRPFVFAGPTVTVTLAAGQTVSGVAAAVLGFVDRPGPQPISYTLCYQPEAGGAVTPASNPAVPTAEAANLSASFSAAGAFSPGAGEWRIGFCVRNGGLWTLDDNDRVSGWIQVTD